MGKKPQNINLDEELVKEARVKCIRIDKSLSAIVEELLRRWLKEKS